jgi:protein-tyrosine phosphatase
MANNLVHIIASDAHDAERRPPILSKAVEEAKKIVGIDKAIAMVTAIPQAILDDKPIPDYGEPINPIKQKKKWAIRLPKF